MFDRFRTDPPPPGRDLDDLRAYSEQRGHQLRRRARRVRAVAVAAAACGAVAAVVVPVTIIWSGTSRSSVVVSRPATSTNRTAAPSARKCTAADRDAQRSMVMPYPQRASEPVSLSAAHSPDLLPAPVGFSPQVSAGTAWAAASLPSSGGGKAAIVLGIDPTSTERSSPVWLVYASDVALTNGYPTGGPLPYGVRGTCQFGFIDAIVDATTGAVLQRGAGLY